jgi:hypothetical protein
MLATHFFSFSQSQSVSPSPKFKANCTFRSVLLFFWIVVSATGQVIAVHRHCVPSGSVESRFTNHTYEVAMNGRKKLER